MIETQKVTLKIRKAQVSVKELKDRADKILNASTTAWFAVTATGQLLFVYFIAVFYGGAVVKGNLGLWNSTLHHGLIEGDAMGNTALAAHLIVAAMITVGGLLQLIPQMQTRARTFHRWNGRLYVSMAIIASLSGLYMIYTRGFVGGIYVGIGNTINALLIMVCALLTWRYAVRGKFEKHRQWALRLFVVVSGVWFFRIIFGFWILMNQSAPGHTDAFSGPFDIFIAFAHTLLPIAVVEVYLWTKDQGSGSRYAMATGLFVLTLALTVGIFGASMIFWMPNL